LSADSCLFDLSVKLLQLRLSLEIYPIQVIFCSLTIHLVGFKPGDAHVAYHIVGLLMDWCFVLRTDCENRHDCL